MTQDGGTYAATNRYPFERSQPLTFEGGTLHRARKREFPALRGLAILGICVWANSIGALVPLVARRFGVDPALISAPLISTLVDTTGLVIFYSIAIVLLIKLA